MNVKELTHSQQQPQAPNAHKRKTTIRLTTSVTMLWAPKGPFFTGSWSWMKSSARHTLSNQQAQLKEAETVNLIENAQRHFQGSLFGCFEYVPYTALTIVCTINVSIDCKKNKVSNPFTRKNVLGYK